MADHGILFSGEMVRALLARRKRVTRRMSKRWLKVKAGDTLWVRETHARPASIGGTLPGGGQDRTSLSRRIHYVADGPIPEGKPKGWDMWLKKPSIHMPRWASRISLIATEDARLERLQDITEEEALMEGVEPFEMTEQGLADLEISDESPEVKEFWRLMGAGRTTALMEFQMLWSTLHTKPGECWEDNPELVRLAFDYSETA